MRMVGYRGTVSASGARRVAHFKHHRAANCSWGLGETQAHLSLKWAVTMLVRAVPGWTAEMEVAGNSRAWIADVLASGPGGRRVAFEVQLAAQTEADTMARTRRYEADGVESVWLTTRRVSWWTACPTLIVKQDESQGVSVVGGCWWFETERWLEAPVMTLDFVLRALLAGSMVWAPLPRRNCGTPTFKTVEGAGWVTVDNLAAWQVIEETNRARRAAQAALMSDAEKTAAAQYQELLRRRAEAAAAREAELKARSSALAAARAEGRQRDFTGIGFLKPEKAKVLHDRLLDGGVDRRLWPLIASEFSRMERAGPPHPKPLTERVVAAGLCTMDEASAMEGLIMNWVRATYRS